MPAEVRTVAGVTYDEVGNGAVPVLLLHGGSGRRQWFDAMSDRLRRDLRMVRPDMPGHGESAATPGRYRVGDFLDAVLAR